MQELDVLELLVKFRFWFNKQGYPTSEFDSSKITFESIEKFIEINDYEKI